MPDSVYATAAVAGRVRGARAVERPSAAPDGAVVVATADECAADPTPIPAGALLIVLGEDDGHPGAYLTLPSDVAPSHLERAVAAARELLAERRALADAERELTGQAALRQELLEIGTALAGERNVRVLLERILTSARTLVAADAGSLYLAEPDGDSGEPHALRFMLAQNDSREGSWRESVLAVDHTSIAGTVAASRRPLVIEDAYALPDNAAFAFNRSFDLDSGYRTQSLLAVPMCTRAGELVGVLQLINRKRDPMAILETPSDVAREVMSFTPSDRRLVEALASQAAVVIDNTRLVEEIQQLFESFVRASVTAIEQRDPPTSGHSFRVASYTLHLAEALNHAPPPAYRHVRFGPTQLQQLRYAALLHDVGKLGVREAVLTKARKLYPFQEQMIRERFAHARSALKVQVLEWHLARLVAAGAHPGAEDLERVRAELARLDDELDAMWVTIERANNPTVQLQEVDAGLALLVQKHFPGRDGGDLPLVTPEELHFLQICRGNLDEGERREIESHVVHSFRFLTTLPWPRDLRRVPEIAALHHEKLNGSGYPHRLRAAAIPVEVRMLTIADIYDALTAGDRPYKASLPPPRALEILEEEAAGGAIDADLVRLFVAAEVYRRPPLQPVLPVAALA